MRSLISACLILASLPDVTCPAERAVRRLVSLDYPDLAVQARMQGEITVRCTIDRRGHVLEAKLTQSTGMTTQGEAILGSAVLDNVKQWRFEAVAESDAKLSTVDLIYKFTLGEKVAGKRRFRFVFQFPNVAHVSSEYMPLMY